MTERDRGQPEKKRGQRGRREEMTCRKNPEKKRGRERERQRRRRGKKPEKRESEGLREAEMKSSNDRGKRTEGD